MIKFENPYLLIALIFFVIISLPAKGDIVGSWLFDDGKGDMAKDASGRGHNGNIINGKWDNGKNGKGLRFDATTYVEVPDHKDFNFTNKLTIALWANIEDLPLSHVGIPGKGHDQPVGSFVFHPTKLDAKNYELRFYTSSGNQWPMAKSSSPITFGEWHHLAGTYDGKEIRVYVDGKPAGSTATKGDINISEGAPLKFANDFGGRRLVGVLDEVYILNEVLDESGVKKAMDGMLLAVDKTYKAVNLWGKIKYQN
ncbi:LamG domain-containing protein [Candidatus Poribacteria bacterium]|nr:LamG domain-containing protein [Candidatus Poribacteria bacterium]